MLHVHVLTFFFFAYYDHSCIIKDCLIYRKHKDKIKLCNMECLRFWPYKIPYLCNVSSFSGPNTCKNLK